MKVNFKMPLMAAVLGMSISGFAAPVSAATHKVEQGDTFWKISRWNNVKLESVLAANPGVDPMNLQIGQTVRVPVESKRNVNTYTVSGNDTFWTISRALHLPLDELMAANPGVDPQNLYPGIVLKLPRPAAPKAKTMAVSAAAAPAANTSTVKTASGQILSYKRVLSGIASAYTAARSENGPWGAVDYFGNPLKVGTIAVDPKTIPLGSKVYITGYSHPSLPKNGMIGYATDAGGAIKGNRIDIFVPDSPAKARQFGFQNVKIYILN